MRTPLAAGLSKFPFQRDLNSQSNGANFFTLRTTLKLR
jgi:hypothetical protein